ncbi:MAG: diguanylate cyclase, partial [Microcoleus sp.]
MKIIFQLMLGYFAVAIFGAECCINPKKLPTSLGDGHGTSPVEGIVVGSQKHSYLRSASRPLTSASAALFLDKLSPIEPLKLPSYNYIQSQKNSRKEPTIRLTIIGYSLVFICLVISLFIRGKTVNSLSKRMRLI